MFESNSQTVFQFGIVKYNKITLTDFYRVTNFLIEYYISIIIIIIIIIIITIIIFFIPQVVEKPGVKN